MTAGNVGNRHPGLGRFRQDCQLLVQRVAPAALDAGKNFHSINIRHSRMTRLTPSPSLCSYGPVEMGAAPQGERRSSNPSAITTVETLSTFFTVCPAYGMSGALTQRLGPNNDLRCVPRTDTYSLRSERRRPGTRAWTTQLGKPNMSTALHPGGHPNSSTCGYLKIPHP